MDALLPVLVVVVAAANVLWAWRRAVNLSGQTTAELRSWLRGPEWALYGQALVELKQRGEDIKQEVMPVLRLLASGSYPQRLDGWLILTKLYPDLAARAADYNPRETIESCRQKAAGIEAG